jgi:putative pyrimidine permease RutG
MSTSALPEETNGYFPHWKLKTGGVIMPDERLPWGQTIVSGLQHGVAMAGGTIIAPLIMGFDPNLALFFSGVGTLIFFVVVGGRVPSYLGSSFSFIAVVIAASAYSGHGPNANLDVALGGIIAAGVVYGIIVELAPAHRLDRDRREIEADDGDDGAGHHRRHQKLYPPDARPHDDQGAPGSD